VNDRRRYINDQGVADMGNRDRSWLMGVLGAALLAACAAPRLLDATAERVSLLPPVVHPDSNRGTAAAVALGKQLFVDTRPVAARTPARAAATAISMDRWPAAVLGLTQHNTRHTESLQCRLSDRWYWDGRAATLEAQVLAAGAAIAPIRPRRNSDRWVPAYAAAFRTFTVDRRRRNDFKGPAAYLRDKVSDTAGSL
jgi:hypothetical protein